MRVAFERVECGRNILGSLDLRCDRSKAGRAGALTESIDALSNVGLFAPRNPMVGSFVDCCARAASGHAAAPPPSNPPALAA